MQLALPVAFALMPKSHGLQPTEPGSDWKKPGGHSWQLCELFDAVKEPGAHATHFTPFPKRPTEHEMQLDCPWLG